jgi:pimeloyl-ACP methyl ester carboxylesterase
MSMKARTFVLVHGAWHNSAHWQPVARELNELGAHTLCVDLPGHGSKAPPRDRSRENSERSKVAGITIEEAARDLLSTLRSLTGSRPVVVGHSIGGVIITRAAELEPGLIEHLVYVSGHIPLRYKSAGAYANLPQWRTGFGENLFRDDPAVTGVVRIDPEGPDGYLEALRAAYYNDVSFDAFVPFVRALTADLPLDFWIGEIEATATRWGSIPRSYVRCLLDHALSPAIQTIMLEDADALTPTNRATVLDMNASHSPFASQPTALARFLADVEVR